MARRRRLTPWIEGDDGSFVRFDTAGESAAEVWKDGRRWYWVVHSPGALSFGFEVVRGGSLKGRALADLTLWETGFDSLGERAAEA